ncbi:MAG: replication-associated recombination protein A [Candidatus Latescibacteria bacterium]|nr:replication-associated recombination protein A [Candidatus Latescibacterota bacterium]
MNTLDLFKTPSADRTPAGSSPLADRMRPLALDEIVGQEDLLAPGKPLRTLIEEDRVPSMILWGPPGSGKTTLARVIARTTGARFVSFSAVMSGVKEIRELIAQARQERRGGRQTILFVDEIHRFNKAQQDAFLPHVEDGTIVLIGATTENPSFEVNAALLSRSRVFVLKPLTEEGLRTVVRRALEDPERGLGGRVKMGGDALDHLLHVAEGDARRALTHLEMAASAARPGGDGGAEVSLELMQNVVGRKALLYDRAGEEHYNLISALHKSLRGSDPDAALYWLARMIASGEDPLYIARRMVRFASEDIGNADPRALSISLAAVEAYRFLGSPEGDLALAQAAVYLATAPKSNTVYAAYGAAQEDVMKHPNLPVPLHIRNAPTGLMQDLGYGADYRYAHDDPNAYTPQDYLPDNLRGRRYYRPTDRGYEKRIQEMMAWWEELKKRQTADGRRQT